MAPTFSIRTLSLVLGVLILNPEAAIAGLSSNQQLAQANPPTFNDVAWGPYLTNLTKQIEHSRIISKKTNQAGTAAFTILANGTVQNLRLLNSSGDVTVDQKALVAIANMSPFQPLPASTHNNLDVKLSFDFGYVRISYALRSDDTKSQTTALPEPQSAETEIKAPPTH